MDANKIQHPKKAAFLAAFSHTGNVSDAARAAAMDRTMHYDWLKADAEYAAAFEEAKATAIDRLEGEAVRRAVDGTDEPVFHKGKVCGTIRRYSDTLLIFLMKGANPAKFRERHEITGPNGGPMQTVYKCVKGDWPEKV